LPELGGQFKSEWGGQFNRNTYWWSVS